MALDFLLRVTTQLTPSLLSLLRLRHSALGESPADAALPWLMLIGLVLCAILLWVLASPIARLVTRRVPQEVSLGALTLADCYSVAFIGCGLYYMASSLPQVLTWSHYLFKTAASTSGDSWKEQLTNEVTGVFFQFAIGVLLLVKGRAWAVALACRDKGPESLNEQL